MRRYIRQGRFRHSNVVKVVAVRSFAELLERAINFGWLVQALPFSFTRRPGGHHKGTQATAERLIRRCQGGSGPLRESDATMSSKEVWIVPRALLGPEVSWRSPRAHNKVNSLRVKLLGAASGPVEVEGDSSPLELKSRVSCTISAP